jgi:DNA polymerase I
MRFLDTVKKIVEKENKYSYEETRKKELITDEDINVLKIVAPDPLSIGGTNDSVREKVTSWEADIKYHENYLYDTGLVPGAYYVRKGQQICKSEYKISDKVEQELKNLLWSKVRGPSARSKET